jgi:hypothetical protein
MFIANITSLHLTDNKLFKQLSTHTLPAVNLAPSKLLYSISHMLNQTRLVQVQTNYIFF